MVELLNCDCMEYIKGVPDKFFDLAIVDPPYGESDAINPKSSQNKYQAKRGNYKEFSNVRPEDIYFSELSRVSKNQIVWGGNFFGLEGGYICWNKNGTAFGEAELAYCSSIKSVRLFEYTWNGMIQHDMKNKEDRVHPTQKPVALYKWLLKNYGKEGDKIFDSHLGSGSIAIACHDLKFDLVGCEIDKDYYDAAVKRYNNHKKQLTIF